MWGEGGVCGGRGGMWGEGGYVGGGGVCGRSERSGTAIVVTRVRGRGSL